MRIAVAVYCALLSSGLIAQSVERRPITSTTHECYTRSNLFCGQFIADDINIFGCVGEDDDRYYNYHPTQVTQQRTHTITVTSEEFRPRIELYRVVNGSLQAVAWDFGAATRGTATVVADLLPGDYVTIVTTFARFDGGGRYTARVACGESGPPPPPPNTTDLRLFGNRFQIFISAYDQRSGRTAAGFAIPQSDVFGFFSIPELTGNAGNPEIFIKVLDARTANGHFWIFYGGLTDLEVRITVVDTVQNRVTSYIKPAGGYCGGSDVSTF
jgi:hypothetical protein